MTDPAAVEAASSDAHRQQWARVLAATVRVTRDLDLAEECVQEAYAAGLQAWLRAGVPDNPAAWLTATAGGGPLMRCGMSRRCAAGCRCWRCRAR